MDTTRRGFMGILGAAAAMLAAPVIGTDKSTAAQARNMIGSREYVAIEAINQGDEVYALGVIIDITPMRSDRVRRRMQVRVGPCHEHSHKADLIGVAHQYIKPGAAVVVHGHLVTPEAL